MNLTCGIIEFTPMPGVLKILERTRKMRPDKSGSSTKEHFGDHFAVEKDDIGPKNTYSWNDNIA